MYDGGNGQNIAQFVCILTLHRKPNKVASSVVTNKVQRLSVLRYHSSIEHSQTYMVGTKALKFLGGMTCGPNFPAFCILGGKITISS